MHVPYETEKFYYGFPVYILAYPDEAVGVGITTGSSSYSLGQMVMIGCDSTRTLPRDQALRRMLPQSVRRRSHGSFRVRGNSLGRR